MSGVAIEAKGICAETVIIGAEVGHFRPRIGRKYDIYAKFLF